MKEWMEGAGDSYYRRNKDSLGHGNDLVWPLLERFNVKDGHVLEIGCANGWRLQKLQERGCQVSGIDPSLEAVCAARQRMPEANVIHGTADCLRFPNDEFSVVIMGFCLWFIEPDQWFKVVCESDRVLKDRGLLIIHDFLSPRALRWSEWCPDGEPIERRTNAWAYDFPKLWLSHPWYKIVMENLGFRNTGKLSWLEQAAALYKDKGAVIGTTAP